MFCPISGRKHDHNQDINGKMTKWKGGEYGELTCRAKAQKRKQEGQKNGVAEEPRDGR